MAIDEVGFPKTLVEQMQEAAEAIHSRLGYDDVLITLVDHEEDELVPVAAAGACREKEPRQMLERRKPVDGERTILDWVALHGETVLVDDLSREPCYVPLFPNRKCELCVPIRRPGGLLGMLSIGCMQANAFDERGVVAMEILADHMALAIENALAYDRMKATSAYFRSMVNGLQDEVMVTDRDHRISDVNTAFLRRMSSTRDEIIGARCYQVVYQRSEPCDAAEFPCPLQRAWESGEPTRAFHIHYDQEGKGTHFSVSALPLCDDQGQVAKVIAACLDVTAERLLEAKLAAIYALGRELVLSREASQIAQAVVNAAKRVLEFQVCNLWLIDEEERTLVCRASTPAQETANISPLPLGAEQGIIVSVARTGEAIYLPDVSRDSRHVRGRLRICSELCLPLKVGERVIGVLNAESETMDAFDKADRQLFSALADRASLGLENARLFEMASQQREQLRALAAQLAEAEEAERQQLAQELHDQVGQNLAALGINLNIVRSQLLEEATPWVRSRLDDSLALVERTTERIRDLMVDLRPPVLDDYGLVAALRWYGEQYTSRTGSAVTLQGEEPDPRLATPVEVALFRIAQEALTNMAKHAQATQVAVTVEVESRTVRLTITDNGIGFNPAAVARPDGHQGWGLVTMTERAEAVGGRCRITSSPGRGTQVVVEVPR